MSKAKELLLKMKALWEDATAPAPAPDPAPMAAPAGTPYTLQDGSQISIVQAGAVPATGDLVTINGAPAPAGTYTLQDGSTLTTDATGIITVYTAAAPITVDPMDAGKTPPAPAPAPAPAAPPAKFEATPENIKAVIEKMTPESMAAMYEAFGTGSTEEQLANLQVVCKALMEYNFGWQIREASQKATADQAIEIYKTNLITAQATMASQKETIDKQELKLKALFELVEEIAKTPTAEPVTLTGNKKEKFEKQEKKQTHLEKMGQAIQDLKTSGQPA